MARLRDEVAGAGMGVWRRSSYMLNLSRGDWPKRANALGEQVAEGKKDVALLPELWKAKGCPDISGVHDVYYRDAGWRGSDGQYED